MILSWATPAKPSYDEGSTDSRRTSGNHAPNQSRNSASLACDCGPSGDAVGRP